MIRQPIPTQSRTKSNLHGLFRIGGQRNFITSLKNNDHFLLCHRFWCKEDLAARVTESGVNLLEIFTVTTDPIFLENVCNKYLHIELSKIDNEMKPEAIGVLHLPLHNFFIAFNDLNNPLDEEFPVFSTNSWMSIFNLITGDKIGEVECLLAIGTTIQIEKINESGIWEKNAIKTLKMSQEDPMLSSNNTQHKPVAEKNGDNLSSIESLSSKKTSDLINILQKSLGKSTLSEDLYEPVVYADTKILKEESFRIRLDIKNAKNLPLKSPIQNKTKTKRSKTSKKRQVYGGEPNTYVTFHANEGNGPLIKSLEGMVYFTNVVEKSCNPIWNKSFLVNISLDYLVNKERRFLVKIWGTFKKHVNHHLSSPSPVEDFLIGVASIDFNVLLTNVSHITGWIDIIDISGNLNGQLNITAQLVDDLQKVLNAARCQRDNQVDNLLDNFESSMNIGNINLCRAIKRKFTELEKISERLRSRLMEVTVNAEFEENMSDVQLEEFEHDLNTEVIEGNSEMESI